MIEPSPESQKEHEHNNPFIAGNHVDLLTDSSTNVEVDKVFCAYHTIRTI